MSDGDVRNENTTVRRRKAPAETSARARERVTRANQRPARRSRSPLVRVLGWSFAFLFLAATVACGVLYVRLQHGPVSLTALAALIERTMSEELARPVRIEDAYVKIDPRHGLVFALRQVTIADSDGTPLALAPEAKAILSWPALKRGRLAVSRVDLQSPRLHVAISDDGSLALRFQPQVAAGAGTADPVREPASPVDDASRRATHVSVAETRTIDPLKALAEAAVRARRRDTASGYLRIVGLSNAVVVVGNLQRRSIINIPELQIDLDHGRTQSQFSGQATIASLTGPIALTFATVGTDQSDVIDIDVGVNGLNPRGLARMLPGLAAAEPLDMRIDGRARLTVGLTGGVRRASIEAEAKPDLARSGAVHGRLLSTYDGAASRFDITEFSFASTAGQMTLAGEARLRSGTTDVWDYAVRSLAGELPPIAAGLRPIAVDRFTSRGAFNRATGLLSISDTVFQAGGAEITAKGEITGVASTRQGHVEGRLSPMQARTFKALWPDGLASPARNWVGGHVTKGQISGGHYRVTFEPARAGDTVVNAAPRVSLTLEAGGVEIATGKGAPPVEIPRGLLRIEGRTIEITAPDAAVAAADGRKLQARGIRFTVVETAEGDQPTAELAFRLTGPLATALDIADREPFQLLRANGLALAGLDGRIEGQLKAVFPVADNVQLSEVQSEGRLRITELRGRGVLGPFDLAGGNIAVEAGDKAIDVKGDLLVKGVTGKFNWQYLMNQPAAQQPPARLTFTLDTADRTALGMDVNDIVLGEVPVEVTVGFTEAGASAPRVRADLTKAELMFEPIAWRKAPGRSAVFQFDVARGPGTGSGQRIELQQARLVGDDIAAEGWLAVGADSKVREFSFPNFTMNVVSRLSAHGKLRPDNVWEVKAKGPSFDGRDVFRSLFNVGQVVNPLRTPPKTGLDLSAELDTVLGFSDTTLRTVRIRAARRDDKMVDFDMSGTLEGGKPFAAVIRNATGGGRQLLAEGADAGQVFKLVGFYPNAVGGLMQLEVNLDAKGATEKSGTLWARDFAVLGDPVVSEVFQNADAAPGTPTPGKPRQRVVRQQFDFEGLRVPFDVGAGQFVMNNAVLRGPLIGASFRGKIDFKQQLMNIGGTYAPLSGLNAAVGGILGPLTGGAQGDGVFGITFAVQGPISAPQVIVNPFSLLAPGIFREIFQLTPETFRVSPRQDGPPASRARTAGPGKAPPPPARASSAAPTDGPAPTAATPAKGKAEVIPDWSSETKPVPKKP